MCVCDGRFRGITFLEPATHLGMTVEWLSSSPAATSLISRDVVMFSHMLWNEV